MPDELRLVLETRDRPYCFRCLRQAFPHEAVRDRIGTLARAGTPILIGEGRRAMCLQATTVVAYIPGDPDLSRLARD